MVTRWRGLWRSLPVRLAALLDKKVAVELYEHDQIDYLTRSLQSVQPTVFLDIGSHAALYSIVLKQHFPEMEVHAFEPDRTNLCQLYANLFVNGFTRTIGT